MTDRIARISRRLAETTPGPWWATEALDPKDDDTAYGVAAGPVGRPYRSIVAMSPGTASMDTGELTDRIADTEFIAHCRQDVPWLLDQLAAARADAERLAASLTEHNEYLSLLYDRQTSPNRLDAPAGLGARCIAALHDHDQAASGRA